MTLAEKKRRRDALARAMHKCAEERDACKRALRNATGTKHCVQLQYTMEGYEADVQWRHKAIEQLNKEIEAMEKTKEERVPV